MSGSASITPDLGTTAVWVFAPVPNQYHDVALRLSTALLTAPCSGIARQAWTQPRAGCTPGFGGAQAEPHGGHPAITGATICVRTGHGGEGAKGQIIEQNAKQSSSSHP